MFPQFPVYNTDGSYAVDQQMQYARKYSIAPAENPVALAHEIEDFQKRYMSSVSGYLDLEIVKGLKAKIYSGMQYIPRQLKVIIAPQFSRRYYYETPTAQRR